MKIHQIDISKKMVVSLDNDEIILLVNLLGMALNANSMTNSQDDTAALMLNALRKVAADE